MFGALRAALLTLAVFESASATSERTVLTLILEYDDTSGESNTNGNCDAACWAVQTFSTSESSVHAIISDGSYGAISFVQAGSERVVVPMGKALASLSGVCPEPHAEAVAALALSNKNAASFHHVEYWFPLELHQHGCAWTGLARSCLVEQGVPPNVGAGCWTYIRENRIKTRAHEASAENRTRPDRTACLIR